MDGIESTSSPPSSSVIFARGVIARLQLWSVLRLAVQEGWGGSASTSSSKQTWLASVIVDAFESEPQTPDDQYVEEMLLQIMADEFDAVLEDGSAESVARDIVRMWDEAREGKDAIVRQFEEQVDKVKGKKVDVREGAMEEGKEDEEWISTDEEEGDNDGESEDEAPQLQDKREKPKEGPIVDEDGFTLVKGKGKR